MQDKVNFQNLEIAYANLTNTKLRKNYYIFGLMNQKILVNIGTFFIKKALRIGLPIKKLIKNTIFDIFCGGETIENCDSTINFLSYKHVGTILDYSVEGESSDDSYEHTKNEIIKTIRYAADRKNQIPYAVFKVTGLGSMQLMIKLNDSQVLNADEKKEVNDLRNRFFEIINIAYKNKVRIFIDAEETWIQNFIDELSLEAMKKYNKVGEVIVFNTYQFYKKNALNILKKHVKEAQKGSFAIGVKIVRGAYMEKERSRAEEFNYEDPINIDKIATDKLFNEGLSLCINEIGTVELCLGTHNEESNLIALDLMQRKGLDIGDERIYFAQLLGMSDNITYNLAEKGYNVAKYVPYGPIEAVMPYLFRRADENTAMAGQSSREFNMIKSEIKRRKVNV